MKELQKLLVYEGYDLGKSGPNKDGVDGIIGRKTLDACTSYLKVLFVERGYLWTKDNIVAFRMSGEFTDRFTDFGFVLKDGKCVSALPWTTKPGKYWVSNPLTVGGVTGTGCIKEGQYISSHVFFTGSNKYKSSYFRQCSNMTVYRDGNKDNKLDKNITQVAPSWYAFQLHPMGKGFSISNWSAGCNGCSKELWDKHVVPYFKNGQKINFTIIEIQ